MQLSEETKLNESKIKSLRFYLQNESQIHLLSSSPCLPALFQTSSTLPPGTSHLIMSSSHHCKQYQFSPWQGSLGVWQSTPGRLEYKRQNSKRHDWERGGGGAVLPNSKNV